MYLTDKLRAEFSAAAEPLMKWIAENGHPHVTVIVTQSNAELVEAQHNYISHKFVQD